MATKRALLVLLAVLPALDPLSGAAADLAIDLKNDGSMAVSVPVGADNGVTQASDFRADADGRPVAIYPDEIFADRFWSQPLSQEDYDRIRTGMPVSRVTLDDAAHVRVRVEGADRKAEYREKWEAAKREAARRETDDLLRKRAGLEERRDALDARVAQAEKALIDGEDRMAWLTDSEERDIDRSLRNIEDWADRRDELQEQRNALAGRSPDPRDEIDRLTAEIRRLNDRIASERDAVRASRDRKRSARTFFMARRKEWQNLVADRRALDAEIRAVDRRIRELSAVLR
ncbi:MAG: hypothetical protein ACM3NF_06190 [Gemmatimonadota bacterium]